MRLLAALDQGTTSSRALLFDERGTPVAGAQREFKQHYPRPGWVEHDPFDILATQTEVLREALARGGFEARDVAAVGISNQRETTLLWDRRTGRPVCNAIVWQCRRTADFCEGLRRDGLEPEITARTGLVADAYFSASKLKWILDNVDGARRDAEAGRLCFGTVDSWLIWNLTGGAVHATDVTNAARTMLYNIHTGGWDDELLRLFDIPRAVLPQVQPCVGHFGHLRRDVLGVEVPILGVAGDQHAALFGQACFAPGDAKNTYGTGCFLLMNTGDKPVASQNRLLTTVAWDLGQGPTYALEGSVFMGGAVIQWLRDEMGLLTSAAQSEELADSVPDSAGVYVVPAFTGLGAPWWDMYARGTIVGLTRGAGRAHVVRAALESIAYQSNDVLQAMGGDAGVGLTTLKVDGGASANGFLLQFQSDLLGAPVVRPACLETTALGAATLAGIGAGVFGGTEDLKRLWQEGARFAPRPLAPGGVLGWRRAVGRARRWVEEE